MRHEEMGGLGEPKRAGVENMDDARIEDWRGNRGTLAEARRILKESVENRRGLDAVGEDSGGVV
jgi:hypothetical protein